MGAAGEGEGGSRKPKASAPAPARRQPAPRADRATPKHNCRASGHVAPKHKRRGSGHTSWVHDDLARKASEQRRTQGEAFPELPSSAETQSCRRISRESGVSPTRRTGSRHRRGGETWTPHPDCQTVTPPGYTPEDTASLLSH